MGMSGHANAKDAGAPRTRRAPRRWLAAINVGVFLASITAIAAAVNVFAQRDDWRAQIDATKTRAYSLSDQTKKLLATLEGQWKVALVLSERSVDRGMRKQIDEVLKRYTDVSPRISVVRVDPVDPRTFAAYDALLSELLDVYKSAIADYDRALDEGMRAFASLQLLTQQHAVGLDELVARTPQSDPMRSQLQQRAGLLALLADQGELVVAEVAQARKADQARPIADYETARSILAQTLSQWSGELDDMAAILSRVAERIDVDSSVKQFAAQARQDYTQMAQTLADAADPLKRLPPMELSAIGAQLAQGEAALIIGPKRATIIPSMQLFPKSNLQQNDDGGVSFDQRFRGEQLISAAIRSLTVPVMPLVVLVHAEDESLLLRRDQQADLVGVASVLKAARYEVDEWMVAKSTARPIPKKGQPVAWVVVPPPPARSIEPTSAVQMLVESVHKLIEDGQAVLLSVSPSLLAKYGQADPIESLAAPFGLRADTSKIVMESARAADGSTQVVFGQAVSRFSDPHAIARAIDGQQAYFGMPVPLGASQALPDGVRQHVVASIEPAPNRWIESDWTSDLRERGAPSPSQNLNHPVPLAVVAERPSPTGRGVQRFMLVASGGWMVSSVADVVLSIGGGRVALVNPGNYELMLASVAWLAGMDDLIAATPMSQEIQRLDGITPQMRTLWSWIMGAGVPLGCVMLGAIVWLFRRS
jgi:hypothetical protein